MDEIDRMASTKVSIEKIVESIRNERNKTIEEFLKNETSLMSFLQKHYQTVAISKVKLEFLKRDLKELYNSSLDLVHFSSLIKELKGANLENAVHEHPLFDSELELVFKKNGFRLD